MSRHRDARWRLAACLALLPCLALAGGPVWAADHLEPGLQGQTMPEDLKTDILPQPYSKGVRLIGHTDLWKRGTNLQMAWVDSCAYVSSAIAIPGLPISAEKANDPSISGVAVIDVSDPTAPKPVRLLQDKASIRAVETMHAVVAPGRKVLAAGAYEARGPSGKPWLDVYDASDCKNPKLMSEFEWPEKVHEVTVSPNGKRVYGTVISPFDGKGGILVLDITDMAHPRYLGKFGVTRPDGTTYEFATHEISISPDEKRIYAGVIASRGGDLNRDITAAPPSAEGLGPNAGGIYILDNSDIAEGRPNPKMRLIGTAEHGGWHSVEQANINGKPYLVGAGELGACPGSWPKIVDISDQRHPRIIGEFKLQMNHKENCPAAEGIEIATRGIVGRPGTAASHFNDVDSATHTRLGLFPFMYAGLRIVDLRDPAKPAEIAYFKPGDPCMSHVRYLARTGQIWFSCVLSGFYVIELTPQVRASVGERPG
ncbi:MAG TPA: hypothetical protein VME42_09210 [Steroidobacteraceae bacterium]|nr:hypothetical protein [Steroidobacteraceae bacterium]